SLNSAIVAETDSFVAFFKLNSAESTIAFTSPRFNTLVRYPYSIFSAGHFSRPPSVNNSAQIKLPDISPPNAPALPYTAPPIVPGTVAAHSSPLRPFDAQRLARLLNTTPDSTQTLGRSPFSKRTAFARFRIVMPRTPLSLTSTFDPPPRMK